MNFPKGILTKECWWANSETVLTNVFLCECSETQNLLELHES